MFSLLFYPLVLPAMIKKFVETKRIKQLIVQHPLGKAVWYFVICGIKAAFFLWSGIKQVMKYLWLSPLTVSYKPLHQLAFLHAQIIEPVFIPAAFHDTDIPEKIRNFLTQPHYDYQIASIPNGRMLWQSTIATQTNTIIRDLTRRPKHGYATNPRSYMRKPQHIIKKAWTAIVLTGNDTFQNLNHRVTYGLAKYFLYEKAWIKADRYIADTKKLFHQEARERLGLPADRLISPQADTVYEFDLLVAATTPTIYGVIPPWMISGIQWLFLPTPRPARSRKVYLKRTGTRRVTNEAEFDAYLLTLWYEILTTSATTPESLDRNLFAAATHIISPHGAWLTKLIFCAPGTTVIELFHPDTFFWHYYAMSRSLALQYHCFIWQKDTSYHWLDMDAPIVVDMDEFEEFMENVG